MRARVSAKIRGDGLYVLDGRQTWYYEDGRKQWELTYNNGRKIGAEVHWSSLGQMEWKWQHHLDGTHVWNAVLA